MAAAAANPVRVDQCQLD